MSIFLGSILLTKTGVMDDKINRTLKETWVVKLKIINFEQYYKKLVNYSKKNGSNFKS